MRAKQYKFTVADLAKLGRAAKYTVYRAIALGRLDPDSLESVVSWAADQKMIEAGSRRSARAIRKIKERAG